MKRTIAAVFGALIAHGVTAGVNDPVEHRHEMMEDTRDALKPMVQMVKGESEFDAATVAAGLDTMKHTAEHAGELFPPGSDTEDDRAKPQVWSDREGFDRSMTDFSAAVEAAQAASPQSVNELKPALDDIIKACKGCHDDYRYEED